MNIILYLLMIIVGFLGTVRELNRKSSNRLFALLILLFVSTAISRVGHSSDISDLTSYINYFLDDNNAYFEPVYVFLTDSIKLLFGYNPYMLIATVSLWIVLFVCLSERICSSLYSTEGAAERYKNTFFLIFCAYWGCCFACEGLRNGMGVSLLFCAIACEINDKHVWAIIACLLAFFVHMSSLVLLPGIIVLLLFKRKISAKVYVVWILALIGVDLLLAISPNVNIPIVSNIFGTIEQIEVLSHYESYEDEKAGSYLSTQYVTYHLFGLLMILGNLKDIKYNRAVLLYFIGLTLGSIFQTSIIVMRIQWLYLSIVVFVLYYFCRSNSFSFDRKIVFLLGYVLIQSIMVLRYLGWYL